MPPSRSLVPHSPLHRDPHAQLRRMLDRIGPGTRPADHVAALEERLATLLGTEAALFFPTGAMAQQVALRIHAERSGRWTFAAHPQNHLDLWEDRGYSAVHGLRLLPAGDRFALLTAEAIDAVGEPLAAVLWELPQREIGGVLPVWDDLVAQVALARSRGAAAHLDGARLWEAQPFYDRPHAEIAGLFDTVYVSLYKGLGGARGAALAADAATIRQARVWRLRLGGAIPDAWPLALAVSDGLDTRLPRMAAYRDHAVAVAAAISADGVARVVPDPPQTAMFHVHLPVPVAALAEAGRALVAARGVQVFTHAQSGPDPARSAFEVTIAEPGLDFTPAEVAALVRELAGR